ncbi:hypothetical protein EN788_56275 [Mesorhizobium sp. M2D.F.Ca.ET.145.01.1.1]|nr:hypothetical protein EN788_56275 [Mesorhizobium sp. M2D.F.Ca.ET.145.01.1.1]
MLRPESTVAGLLVALGLGRNLPIPVVSIAFLASCAGLVLLPDMHTQLGSVFVYLTAAIFTGSLLHLALYAKAFAQLLRWRPLAYLGRISFGLYVFHLWAFVEGMSLLRMTPIPENYATRCLAGMSP